jgi:hypothetical protein
LYLGALGGPDWALDEVFELVLQRPPTRFLDKLHILMGIELITLRVRTPIIIIVLSHKQIQIQLIRLNIEPLLYQPVIILALHLGQRFELAVRMGAACVVDHFEEEGFGAISEAVEDEA